MASTERRARKRARSGNRNLLSVAPSARAARRLPGARSREPDAVKSSEPGSPGEGTARTTGTHVTSGISGRAQGTASSERVRQQNERYRAIDRDLITGSGILRGASMPSGCCSASRNATTAQNHRSQAAFVYPWLACEEAPVGALCRGLRAIAPEACGRPQGSLS